MSQRQPKLVSSDFSQIQEENMRRVSRIFILTILLLSQIVGINAADIVPHNGVAYVLIPREVPPDMERTPSEFHGVYRLNDYSDPYDPLVDENGKIIFDLNIDGAVVVNGLAANQQNQLYLFIGPDASGEYTEVSQVGWLPAGKFEDDSPAYIKLIGQPFSADQVSQDIPADGAPQAQYPHGTTNYDNDFWDYGWEVWPYTHSKYIKGPFTDESGKSYMYKFDPIAPASHKNLPLWNGPGPSSAGIKHPTDPYKVILPNKWGGISWYAFGSPNAPAAHAGKLMNGQDDLPLLDQYDFRLSHTNRGNYSPYGDAKYISTVVKRVYEKRDRALDLYAYDDDAVPPKPSPNNYPKKEAENVLTATDLKISEMYGKSCADGCIPGGTMNPEAIAKIESCVQVFTSTTGRRYGFNPFGTKEPPYGPNDAALRVVMNDSDTTYNLDVNDTNIRNIDYLEESLGVPVESATIIGVSSNFATPSVPPVKAPDHLYASIADKFCIQDSWWGNGGVAYEYFSKDTETDLMTFLAGHIYRLNYLENDDPTPEDVGFFEGDIDAIGVDGHGNLYILTTELDCPNIPETGLPDGPDLPAADPHEDGNDFEDHEDHLAISSWFRPGDEESDYEIAEPEESGDYVKIYFKQQIRKVCRKYTPSAGGGFSMSTVKDRGYVESGYDAIRRDVVYDGSDFVWKDDWRHDFGPGSRTANIDAEFAVVNIAERPPNIDNEGNYSFCRLDRTTSETPISEDTEVTFKIEGYRPYGANGEIQHLVDVGEIPGLGEEVYVNIIPPYEDRDEDGDGIGGSFPSGMFETNGAHKFDVKWHVDLIDPRAGADYGEGQVIERWHDLPASGTQKLLNFTFPRPGTYAVYATFKYHVFKYDELAPGDRPDKLVDHIETREISASDVQKVLYHVQASMNVLHDGWVTNITLDKGSFFEDVYDADQTDYHIKEDTRPATPSLSFSFDAQFIRDANVNSESADFETYDGVGIWDYGDTPHVYNYDDGDVDNSEYNPGKQKFADEKLSGSSPYPFECGTRVDEPPNEKDLAAITYRLLIYPPVDRGEDELVKDEYEIYASGTCALASTTYIGDPDPAIKDQKYRIKVKIPPENINRIMTPIDPNKFFVRLELEYPRVTWKAVTHKDASGIVTEDQYYSIVPASPSRALITNDPPLDGLEDDVGLEEITDDHFFDNIDFWEICARDVTVIKPEFVGIEINEDVERTQVATHTTGDDVPPCKVKMSLVDNNPYSHYEDVQLRYEVPKNKRDLLDVDDENVAEGAEDAPFGPKPTSTSYYATDSYVIGASYTFIIPEYGGEGDEDGIGESDLFSPGKTFEHWIGSLSFSLEGKLYDGLDEEEELAEPHIFDKDADDERLRTYTCGLIRHDNDPPTIRVNLVSQADDRRWEITLEEANTDLAPNPPTLDALASCPLNITCYKISSNTTVVSEGEIEVPGSSNHPIVLNDHQEVDLASATDAGLIAAMPTVRRSSRLLVSVGIADNVDYQDLSEATIEVTEITDSGSQPLLALQNLKTAFNAEDDFEEALTFNRGRYYIDVPMKVLSGQSLPANPQLEVKVYARDSSGNERTLIIPIKVSESSFDTRVLESSENR
jgi:hypothetical protein